MTYENSMDFIFLYTCGDATDTYDVVVSGPCTFGKLVDFIMLRSKQNDEYGDIWILTESGKHIYILSYKNGKRDHPLFWVENYDENILDKYKDKNVVKITANGGYSLMSYDIRIAEFDTEVGVSDG